jgi:bisphosphoglycerate-independent phosphoglycerate mutase (AlkP superfamily)
LFYAAMEHLKLHQPRVFFVGFLETDHWQHEGRYDRNLDAAHMVDEYTRRLWEYVQSQPKYRDKTTFILTTDHGRGDAPENWKHHGEKIDGADDIWMAILGPDTPPLGERTNCDPITQSQVAATVATLLGEDFNKAVPQAGKPVAEAFPGGK